MLTCGFRDPSTQICQVLGRKTPGPQCRCPFYQHEPLKCDYCGNFLITPPIVTDNRIACQNCMKKSGTCALCSHVKACQIQAGSSTCVGCPCFHIELGCMRQNGTCGSYQEV